MNERNGVGQIYIHTATRRNIYSSGSSFFMIGKFQSQRQMILEDLVIYSLISLVNIFYDFIYNFLLAANLIILNRGFNPISYGLLQAAIFVFCLFQIVRKVRQLRYYA